VPEPLRRRISFFPGDDEGVFCILSGGSFVRSVCLSCAGGFLLFLLFDLVRMVGATNNPLRLLFLLLLAAVGGGAERNSWLRFGRSVTFSFAAKGERIGSSPASQVCAGLLAWPATAAASSDGGSLVAGADFLPLLSVLAQGMLQRAGSYYQALGVLKHGGSRTSFPLLFVMVPGMIQDSGSSY